MTYRYLYYLSWDKRRDGKSISIIKENTIFFSAEEGVRVHFEVSFEPVFTAVSTGEVRDVLQRELEASTPRLIIFPSLPDSLHIEVYIIYLHFVIYKSAGTT